MHTQSVVPTIGTEIKFSREDAALQQNGKTYAVRIAYDAKTGQWEISSRFSDSEGVWVPLRKGGRAGLIVFLNDDPTSDDTHLVISAIQPTGRGAWADVVSKS